MGPSNYSVQFEPYTERHYVKNFQKEYLDKWLATERIIIMVCERKGIIKREFSEIASLFNL